MDDLPALPTFTYRKTSRVQGPRPCSWISTSSTSVDDHDIWSWTSGGADLARISTMRSYSSGDSTYSNASSSSSSSPSVEYAPNILPEYGAQPKPRSRHSHRRKPAGPRSAHDALHFVTRPALTINTTAFSRLQKEVPRAVSVERSPTPPPPGIPPSEARSPTDFLLDWDEIFEVLGCSRVHLNDAKG
ncbi:hypothetical protein PAXRUDRAFT_465816 [Paxillus rubicundulus Ve08.2h10]|uniref:Uncharacterized protein n=1 Tax=Paxillus rubicundulus Ve08.2h10 TaxID=930991 RepID=A0A0D0E9T1_9AGAM|nr:hypothetical protein PAXRUDRAFT_465816 [Paxillus rubicundulus Ve08.2h10]